MCAKDRLRVLPSQCTPSFKYRLEDALTNCKKLQHTLKVKDKTIVSLETRLEAAHVFELECNKITKSLDEKKIRITQLKSRVRIFEGEKHENEAILRTLKEKEDNAVFLGENLKSCMDELAVLENRFILENNLTRFVKIFEMGV
ncbi:Hypothetical predicted protein [Paramuricea clavata]|uniref:Uncharacterized protein n=1 Tax=Paramuricea clavata TaxID=317549 RepID=A0A6S7JUV6_PARCT|nr:Hypothetical predicted protein [Paramuricea clavata]